VIEEDRGCGPVLYRGRTLPLTRSGAINFSYFLEISILLFESAFPLLDADV